MMRLHLITATLIAWSFSGCTSSISHLTEPTQSQQYYEVPSPKKKAAYEKTMRKVASGIKYDPNYQRIALNTPEKKEWFKKLTYSLWDRQITRQQFVTEGLKRYPHREYEFNFIVKGFTFN